MVAVSLIYIYYNSPKDILTSLASVRSGLDGLQSEIIIVDNASDKAIPEEVKRYKPYIIRNNKNVGYGAAVNIGAEQAKGKLLFILNADLVFLSQSIRLLVEKLKKDSSIGIIGPAILNKEMQITCVGNNYPFLPDSLFAFSFINKISPYNYFSKRYYISDFDRKAEHEIPVLCGACLLIRTNVFREVRGFDEQFFMYFEESDICYRIQKKGYKILYYPRSKVIHSVGGSSSNKKQIQKRFEHSRYLFTKKYQGTFLALLSETFLRCTSSLSLLNKLKYI